MSKLSAFLHPVTTSEEKEVVISNRFQDESGQPVPFKIRALTQEENDAITRQATRRRKEGGQTIEQLDSVDFTRRMVVAATVGTRLFQQGAVRRVRRPGPAAGAR